MRFVFALLGLCALVQTQAEAQEQSISIGNWVAESTTDLLLEEWSAYKMGHNKFYIDNEEDQLRFKIFQHNKLLIAQHNQLYAIDKVSYEMGLNEFSDWLPEEIMMMNGYNRTEQSIDFDEEAVTFIPAAFPVAPPTWDWRSRGAITRVKSQGRCGSCWAFSSTGALEAHQYIRNRHLIELSEQNLVDCSRNFGNHGCGGGWMNNAFHYIQVNRGIDTERSYPYRGVDGRCAFKRANVGATDRGFATIQRRNERAIMEAVATRGPVSIAIDSRQAGFTNYHKGVYDDPHCSQNSPTHALLIVGYGNENGHDYWLVKNSWGPAWGDRGYIKIARGKNTCGISNFASYPLL